MSVKFSITAFMAAALAICPSILHASSTDTSGVAVTGDKHVRYRCKEKRFEDFDSAGELDWLRGRTGACNPGMRPLSTHYVVQNGKVYWLTKTEWTRQACISGTGDLSALFYNLSWRCMFSEPGQIDAWEERQLSLLGAYTPEFRVYNGRKPPSADWQRAQQDYYATDGTSVYFTHIKIKGADPRYFATFFPFGDDEKWQSFYFSRSRSAVYLAGNRIPDVDLTRVTLLEPVRCPGHGLDCTYEYSLDCDHGYWGCRGLLGRAGTDVVYLQKKGVTVFKGMAADDLFMFMTSKRMYFYSKGKFYEVVRDGFDTSATLVDMDKATYEREP